jgi:hypothetical protein
MLVIPCNSCGMALPEWELSSGELATCPDCGAEHVVHLFPAALRISTADRPDSAAEGEATCFDHAANRAIATCAQCGRFVCQLCAVEFERATYCPSCFAAGRSSGTQRDLETSRVTYDSIALTVAVGPVLFFPIMVLTAPVAIFLSVWYWKRPLAFRHANRWRFVVAILAGLVELSAFGWLIIYLLLRRPTPTV